MLPSAVCDPYIQANKALELKHVSHVSLQAPKMQRAKTPASSNFKTTGRDRIVPAKKIGSVDVGAAKDFETEKQ